MTDTTAVHAERPHARLGASASPRYTVCTASVQASIGVPTYSSDFAREGTAGHEMAEACLTNGQEAIEWVDRAVDGFTVDEDWAEAIQVYLDECRKYMGPGWVHWIERPISLAALNPPEDMYGTADFVAYHAVLKLLVIVDLKFGKGIGVEAKGNSQLKFYALGAYLGLPAGMHVERIQMIIVQPRIPYGEPIRRAETDPLELTEWSAWLMERVRIALSKDEATFVPGPHCQKTFCPRSGNCPAQAKAAFAFAQEEFDVITVDADTPEPKLPEVRTLTSAQVAGILNAAPVFEGFLTAVREFAKDGIHRGWLTVPGWTITEGEGRPKWTGADDAVVAGKLKSTYGLTDDQVWTKKLTTYAQARNGITANLRADGLKKKEAEEKAKELLKNMISTNSTGIKLVPVASGKASAALRGDEFSLLVDAPSS